MHCLAPIRNVQTRRTPIASMLVSLSIGRVVPLDERMVGTDLSATSLVRKIVQFVTEIQNAMPAKIRGLVQYASIHVLKRS